MSGKGKVALACKVCASRNYTTHKSSNIDKRLEVKKYCKYCGKHTLHGETK